MPGDGNSSLEMLVPGCHKDLRTWAGSLNPIDTLENRPFVNLSSVTLPDCAYFLPRLCLLQEWMYQMGLHCKLNGTMCAYFRRHTGDLF